MGHVIGVSYGRKFRRLSVMDDDPHFTGPEAIKRFDEVGGGPYPGKKVPLQGPTSRHWRSDVFGPEVMSSANYGRKTKISVVSLGALEDIGYEVDYSQAEPYTLWWAYIRSKPTAPLQFDIPLCRLIPLEGDQP